MLSTFKCLRPAVATAVRFGPTTDWALIRGLASLPQPATVETVKNSKGVVCLTAKQNANFERFYRAQGVCASEEEFAAFLSAARRGLPSVFRVLANRPEAKGGRAAPKRSGWKWLIDWLIELLLSCRTQKCYNSEEKGVRFVTFKF